MPCAHLDLAQQRPTTDSLDHLRLTEHNRAKIVYDRVRMMAWEFVVAKVRRFPEPRDNLDILTLENVMRTLGRQAAPSDGRVPGQDGSTSLSSVKEVCEPGIHPIH